MKTLVLTQSDVRGLLDMEQAITAVEAAFAAHGRGETLMPPKVYLGLPQHGGDFRAMPSYSAGAAGVKWINSHPDNPKKHGLPSVIGLYVLSDPDTALPLAILDATWLTAVRTGAGAAVASRHLARKTSRTLGFIGSGVQARTLLAAHRACFSDLAVIAADSSQAAAERFAAEAGGKAGTIAEAAACDIVCTATPSRAPVIERAWVKAGAHVNAMGADAPGKQELDPRILKDARIFIDDAEQALESGEVNVPLHHGQLSREAIAGTLGQVIAGRIEGRRSDEEITIFDSTGLALQDLALARLIHEKAREKGVGQAIDLLG
ncbi:MAG: ornithine cyclodeaminase family protein [Byssovorax sp.]